MNPLHVRIVDSAGNDRHVKFTGLRTRKSATGGWTSAECHAVVATDTFTDLDGDNRLYVYDDMGKVVWEGYLDNPGLTQGPFGQALDLSALGPSKWALAAAYPRLWVDQRLTSWTQSGRSIKNADLSVADLNSDEDFQALQTAASDGATITSTWAAEWKYAGIRAAGLAGLGRVRCDWQAGITDANYTLRLQTSIGNFSSTDRDTHTSSTAGGSLSASAGGGTPITIGDDMARLRVTRDSGTDTGANTRWWQFVNLVVRALLLNVNGAIVSTGYTANYVLASEVIADCIGAGLLQLVDPSRVTIDTTTTQIDQLASDEAITGGGVIDMLSIYDDLTWGYYDSIAGLHRARFQLYGTEPRYVISTRDGFTQPGSEADACNRVAVSYTKPNGKQVTKVVKLSGATAPWKDFDAITLPDGFGSDNNAAIIGQRVLAQSQFPPKSATAVVRRKILDLQTGCMVKPWEIEPGYPVLVQETGDVLRLSETEYDHDSRAVTLTLGTPRRSVEQWVAMLTKKSAFLGPATYALPALTATVHKKKGK